MTVSRLLFLSANADEWYTRRTKYESQVARKRHEAAIIPDAVNEEQENANKILHLSKELLRNLPQAGIA